MAILQVCNYMDLDKVFNVGDVGMCLVVMAGFNNIVKQA